jgi:hypothetical protein
LFIHTCRYYLWAQKGQQVILRKKGSSEKYIDIILGHKKGSKLFSEKRVVLRNTSILSGGTKRATSYSQKKIVLSKKFLKKY